MATRKKTEAKNAPSKKPVPRSAKAKAVDVEVVTEVPDLMTPEIVKQIEVVEDQLGQAGDLSESRFCNMVQHYAKQAASFSNIAVRASASALVYAWGCGKLLNAAKEKYGRSEFGRWRDTNLVPFVMSERTSQRYMQLANLHDDVRALLEWNPGLRQAYVACGILPEPERADGEEDKEKAPKTQAVLRSLTGLQKNLRLFTTSGEKLGKIERTQLALVRRELNRFFDQILSTP